MGSVFGIPTEMPINVFGGLAQLPAMLRQLRPRPAPPAAPASALRRVRRDLSHEIACIKFRVNIGLLALPVSIIALLATPEEKQWMRKKISSCKFDVSILAWNIFLYTLAAIGALSVLASCRGLPLQGLLRSADPPSPTPSEADAAMQRVVEHGTDDVQRELQSSLDDIRMINKKAEKTAVALATRLGENLSTPPR
jgi:hypothetical protein